jgi:hypothetical protein
LRISRASAPLRAREWAIADIVAVMFDKVEGVEDCDASALPTAQLLERDKPSGPSTTASPSIVKLLALICSAAAAITARRCGYKAALRGVTADDHPVTVMLDFVDPIGPDRRS